jgi:hypothetical protein
VKIEHLRNSWVKDESDGASWLDRVDESELVKQLTRKLVAELLGFNDLFRLRHLLVMS